MTPSCALTHTCAVTLDDLLGSLRDTTGLGNAKKQLGKLVRDEAKGRAALALPLSAPVAAVGTHQPTGHRLADDTLFGSAKSARQRTRWRPKTFPSGRASSSAIAKPSTCRLSKSRKLCVLRCARARALPADARWPGADHVQRRVGGQVSADNRTGTNDGEKAEFFWVFWFLRVCVENLTTPAAVAERRVARSRCDGRPNQCVYVTRQCRIFNGARLLRACRAIRRAADERHDQKTDVGQAGRAGACAHAADQARAQVQAPRQ